MDVFCWYFVVVDLIGTHYSNKSDPMSFAFLILSNAGLSGVTFFTGQYAQSLIFMIYLGVVLNNLRIYWGR
jgi:hypothetical protein